MGNHQPFVVWCQQDAEVRDDAAREVIGNEAYTVLEFDR
jgi:hypothetical protein